MDHARITYPEKAQRGLRLLRPILALPVFYKVLIANSLIIFVGATGGTWLAANLGHGNYATLTSLILFIAFGWLISIALNFVVLQFAFQPLMHLGKVMNRVQAGERTLRAPLTGTDPQADQLAQTFNTMLEALDESSRQRASQILNAQEEERKRIARELHDETSQVLTSLLISLAILEESIQTEEARKRISDTRVLAHQTLRAIRSLSIDLRPSALDDLGLSPALRWYIKEYQQKCPVEVEFHATHLKDRLPAEMETALYRIVQECLTNTARHANAHKVSISLVEESEAVHATIVDDGAGFDYAKLLKTPHQERGLGQGLGLTGMQERAVLLNGELEIHTAPGRGTRVEVRIPLPKKHTDTKSRNPMKIRILLADDHTILRAGLKMMLNAQPDMDVVGEAQDGRHAMQEALRLHPDIILMDITMPDMNGIEATKQIKKQFPEVKVLILTMHENDEYVFQALRAGASGYMLKEAADTELINALHVIRNGHFYLSPTAQSVMVGDYLQRVRAGEEKDSYSSLTEREREILKLVAEGYTNNQIAERLVISPKTVDTHRTHIMDKLNLHSRAELVKYAMRRGLLED